MNDSSRILLVSSNNDYFKDIADHLSRMGCKITTVSHALELEILYSEKPSLSLFLFSTDLTGLQNFDLVVKGRNLYPDTPFFLFMSEISLHSLRLAEYLKLNEVIRNPVDINVLEQLIIKYLKTES